MYNSFEVKSWRWGVAVGVLFFVVALGIITLGALALPEAFEVLGVATIIPIVIMLGLTGIFSFGGAITIIHALEARQQGSEQKQ